MLPISFLSKTFLLPSFLFFPPHDRLLTQKPPKNCWQNFLPKKICSSKTCYPKFPPHFAPQIFHPKEFAPYIFPPKNLLPNIFALHITSHNEILLTKIPPKYFCWWNFLLTRICSSKNAPQNFLPRKFSLKTICFPFCPQFFIQKNLLPKYFLLKICCQTFLLSILLLTKIASQILLPKNLCCPNRFVEQLWYLIDTSAVAVHGAVPAALLLIFCHLLKNYCNGFLRFFCVILLPVGEQKKHPTFNMFKVSLYNSFLVHG